MNIYHVQDADRPMWVVATSYSHALDRWRDVVAVENEMLPGDVEEPQGIAFVCGGNELLLPKTQREHGKAGE